MATTHPAQTEPWPLLGRVAAAIGSLALAAVPLGILPIGPLPPGQLIPAARAGELVGQVELEPPYPLPSEAVLDVQLLDVSLADAPAVLLGRSRLLPQGPPPYAFRVAYRDGVIRADRRYQLRATIHQGQRLLFHTDTAHPVLDGRRGPRRLPLVPVGDAPLRGLAWLRAPAASVPVPPGAARLEQQILLDPFSQDLSGSADCNRFIGRFRLEADQLQLDPLAGTEQLCEPAVMADEQRFLQALRQVRRWRLDSRGRLELRDADGSPLLLLETRPGS